MVYESPLHWLVAFDDEEVRAAATVLRQICVESDADISWNHPSIDLPGRFPLGSPLHFAAHSDNVKCMKTLLNELSVSANLTGSSESTALEYAVPRRKVHAAELLISKGALINSSSSYVIRELGMTLHHEILAAAGVTHESPADLTVKCLDAVLQKRPELLNAGADECLTPLIGAVEYHDRDTVKALIDRRCDVHVATAEEFEGKTALHFITHNKLQYENDDILDLLQKAGADLFARTLFGGKSVLHLAARDDCSSVAAQLLAQGMFINETTSRYGQTALFIAAYYGSYTVAQLLLERGADTQIGHLEGTVHAQDWNDLTPLAVAATQSRKRMVELLLTSGASPIARPSSKHTVIHLAVAELDSSMLTMLLEVPQLASSKVINARTADGMTALHYCAGSLGRHDHLALLLNAGADVSALTETGHSVLDIAYQIRDELRRWLGEEVAEIPNLDEEEVFDLWHAVTLPNTPTMIDGATCTVSVGEDPEWDSEQGERDEIEQDKDEEVSVSSNEAREDKSRFNAVNELERWHGSIKMLERQGAKRWCADRFPRKLLSLTLSKQTTLSVKLQ